MKICINSPDFLPRMGGLSNMTALLAGELSRRGHQVRVLTSTLAEKELEALPYGIVRDPHGERLMACSEWCDVFIHSNMSLKAVKGPILKRKPWLAIHHGWYSHPERPRNLNAWLKLGLARFASANVAVSQAVADYTGLKCQVILNPWDEASFHDRYDVPRERDILFVGRLVSDKAPDIFVEALGRLKAQGVPFSGTITGSGPEEQPLRAQAERLGIDACVEFTGPLTGEALARVMCAHRIMVVPSTIREGLPLVALEGVATGCVIVGSEVGGLPESIGKCGLTFPSRDITLLVKHLKRLLHDPNFLNSFAVHRPTHLDKHRLTRVGDAYEEVLHGIAG